jgi:putative transposase
LDCRASPRGQREVHGPAPKTDLALRDHDGKFSKEFDEVFENQGIEVKPVGPHVPNMNAHAERWVGSLRQEALDHFIVFGEAHLRHICETYVEFHNTHRPHQSLDNETLARDPPQPREAASAKKVVCQEFLGGLLKHYSLAA